MTVQFQATVTPATVAWHLPISPTAEHATLMVGKASATSNCCFLIRCLQNSIICPAYYRIHTSLHIVFGCGSAGYSQHAAVADDCASICDATDPASPECTTAVESGGDCDSSGQQMLQLSCEAGHLYACLD